MTCKVTPYNISTLKEFNLYTPTKKTDYNTWLNCISKKYISDINTNILNTNKLINDKNSTSDEINNYSMTLYKKDLNYTFGKILFLIVIVITYMYCFKLTGIIPPLFKLFEKFKLGINTVTDKINKELPKIKDKIPEIKDKIADALPTKLTNKITNKISNKLSKIV